MDTLLFFARCPRPSRFNRVRKKQSWTHGCRLGVGWSAICIGVAGMLFHLNSQFFSDLTLKNLVYTAPFVAPLAFTGIGLLLIMNGMIRDTDLEWAQWVVFLAGCGWFGNFILSVFDHAQNGFFNPIEWLPVFTSAIAVGSLVTGHLGPLRIRFAQILCDCVRHQLRRRDCWVFLSSHGGSANLSSGANRGSPVWSTSVRPTPLSEFIVACDIGHLETIQQRLRKIIILVLLLVSPMLR